MRLITLKIPDDILEESDRQAEALHVSRAEYIRRAIHRANRERRATSRAKRLARVSRKVRGESMRVNEEFARFESAPDA